MVMRMKVWLLVLSLTLLLCSACTQSAHSPTPAPTSQPSVSDIQFIYLDRGTQRDDGKWIARDGHISGEIQNAGNIYMSGVTITVDWYSRDLDNTYLRSDNQNIYSLPPSGTHEFEIYYNGTGSSTGIVNIVYISNVW